VNTATGILFGSEHGQALGCFEHNKQVYYLAHNMVKHWAVLNTVTGVLFDSEHGQAVNCCEHSNGCIIWLRICSSS